MEKILITILLIISSVYTSAKPMDKVIEFYQDKPSISAEFEQDVTVKSPNRVLKRKGRVYFKRPGSMRWDYTWPDEVYYVSNGKTFWAYDVDEEIVYRSTVKKSSLFFALKILFNFKGIYDEFTCKILKSTKDTVLVELIPNRKLPLKKLELMFKSNSGQIIQTRVIDNLDNISIVKFKKQTFKDIPDQAFDFKIPKGIPVHDLDKNNKEPSNAKN